MFKSLQKKWKVTPRQLVLILCTFATTGTLTAYISRSITEWLQLDPVNDRELRLALRLLVLIFGYQVIILIVSFFFGQFKFFWNYEKKILRRMKLIGPAPAQIAVFASGKGSNAEKIIQYLDNHKNIHVKLIVCNKPGAGVLDIAARHQIPTLLLEKQGFYESRKYVEYIENQNITHIVLAGFLWKIPDNLIQAYPEKIINIHPALLPKYGGKGMYGEHVHQSVLEAGEKESGITIHLVDEEYDHGKTIFQTAVSIDEKDTPASLAEKIHALEHQHFPAQIEKWIQQH
jgi:formyltetrahydrofolate-dependent phosphoribosylglycinamide formyltransferase